jgi:TolB-like protein/DNA-binding winged helix-turn-helix (wHTH) protein
MSAPTGNDKDGSAAKLRIGGWQVDPGMNEIRRDGETVKLEPKAIEVLLHLARRAGQPVGREELLAAAWTGVVVGDDALTQAIIKLRKALGDDAHRPRYIETISKRGYRLIARVERDGKPVTHAAEPRGGIPRRYRAVIASVAGLLVLGVAALLAFPEIARTIGMPWPIVADQRGGAPHSSKPLIAVLPLSNLSGDPKRDYFGDGVTEDIINALGRFSTLSVMSRNAVEPFKTRPATPQAVRSELGARYVLTGSLREGAGKLRVGVELSDADKGTVLWSERYEGDGKEVFEIQDRIVTNIVGTLAEKVAHLEQNRVLTKPLENMQAYDLVLRARSLLIADDRSANREARALLAQAQKLAPDYAESYITLAEAELKRATYGWVEDPDESVRSAELHAKRALSIDDPRALPRAHSILAAIYMSRAEFDRALDEANHALALNPSDSASHRRRGEVLLWLGRIDESIPCASTPARAAASGCTSRSPTTWPDDIATLWRRRMLSWPGIPTWISSMRHVRPHWRNLAMRRKRSGPWSRCAG